MARPSLETACSRQEFLAAQAARHGADNQAKLAQARVGIAGLGGLGSATALHLARLGIGTLVIADHDTVDLANLHRQQYALAHLGMLKTDALAMQIEAINPFIEVETHTERITPDNATRIFARCGIVCEAFDDADQKALLVETLLGELPSTIIVSGSGMAGMGSANTIMTSHPMKRLYSCGDGSSDVAEAGTLVSSRVGVCAGHQANMVLRLVLGKTEHLA